MKAISRDSKNWKSKRWLLIVKATFVAFLFVSVLGPVVATKFFGVDDINVRRIYYHAINNENSRSFGQKATNVDNKKSPIIPVIYDPFINSNEPDRLKRIANELNIVASYKPGIIIFDYVFSDTTSYSNEAKKLMVSAVKACLDSGIVFITDVIENEDSSFFQKAPYSLDVLSGSSVTPFSKLNNVVEDNKLKWIPIVVSDTFFNRASRDSRFYQKRYMNFDPSERMETANSSGYNSVELQRLLCSKIVIFSDYSSGDDMHELLSFPIIGVDSVKKVPSGAELLWYAVRDELNDFWDVELATYWSLLVSVILSFLYLLTQTLIRRRYDKYAFLLLIHLFVYMSFLAIIGYFFMRIGHYVLQLAIPAISLVLIDIFSGYLNSGNDENTL